MSYIGSGGGEQRQPLMTTDGERPPLVESFACARSVHSQRVCTLEKTEFDHFHSCVTSLTGVYLNGSD